MDVLILLWVFGRVLLSLDGFRYKHDRAHSRHHIHDIQTKCHVILVTGLPYTCIQYVLIQTHAKCQVTQIYIYITNKLNFLLNCHDELVYKI